MHTEATIARFLSRVRFAPYVGACAEWTGSRHPDGYGQMSVDNKTRRASRLAWEMVHGPIPKGLCVCHKCDNPACVEPSHLWLGTKAQNWDDMRRKGRNSAARGPDHTKWSGGRAEAVRRDLEKRRERYANDPEYREMMVERTRAYRARRSR
jgi:hypothetical protein